MTALRSRRLEILFSKTLDELTAADIQSLVQNNVEEAFDLDFKDELYGNSDKDRRDLAGDIAALANTAGGIIILGVGEDDHAVAVSSNGVHLGDAEVQRMRQITASLTAPLPMFDILPIPLASENSIGYYVIAVPRSNLAPHAVLINNALRYPKRNGSTTRYLSEAEVAGAYSDRFRRFELQVEQIERLSGEAFQRLDPEQSWLAVTLVPDLPGSLDITQKTLRAFTEQIRGTSSTVILDHLSATFHKTSVGHRRLVAFDSVRPDGRDSWASAQFHADGSGSYCVSIYELQGQIAPTSTPESRILNEESIVDATISGLHRLAQHARDRAAAGGNAIIHVNLITQTDPLLPVTLGHARRGLVRRSGTVNLRSLPHPVEIVAALDDLAITGPALVGSAAAAVNQLAQMFGIAELGQLTTDGQIRRRYWSRDWQSLIAQWALPAHVEVIEDEWT